MSQEQQNNALSQIIAKCWADESFKQALIADPHTTLAAEGHPVPDNITINVVENTPSHITITIPEKPADLTDEDLDNIAGGVKQVFCLLGCFPV